jgi:hypothetical protein
MRSFIGVYRRECRNVRAEVGRHEILTHCYWREGGSEFANVNIMAVCHGTDKDRVFAHKAAIDAHLASCGISVDYTNVFWGGRSENQAERDFPESSPGMACAVR